MASIVVPITCFLVFLIVLIISSSIRILPEYQRALVFRLGRPIGVRGPGLYLSMPLFDRSIVVDLRPQVREAKNFKFFSRDQVRMEADWLWNYNVIDVEKSILNTPNFEKSAEEATRSVFQEIYAADLLATPGEAEARLAERLRNVAATCGLRVNEARVTEFRKSGA